jgi:hypothetical protein
VLPGKGKDDGNTTTADPINLSVADKLNSKRRRMRKTMPKAHHDIACQGD